MPSAKLAAAGLFALFTITTQAATTMTVTDLPIDRGGTVRIAHMRPDSPKATIVWATGGNGAINLMQDGNGDNPNFYYNIPYRTRQLFVDRGYSVVLVDVAYADLTNGIDLAFRASPTHLSEWRAVLAHVRARDDVPVWLIGFSAGSISAANMAVNLPESEPWGLVFLNAGTNSTPVTVFDFPLETIRRPVLVASHAEDPCPYTPPHLAAQVLDRLTSATAKRHIIFTGGQGDQRPIECDSLGHHGLGGQDAEFVEAVAGWTAGYAHLAHAPSYTALWLNLEEAGWGLNVNHQGNILFATLFTYDSTGQPLWLHMSEGVRQANGTTYSGSLYRTTGPAFNAVPFAPFGSANYTAVGTMSLNFTSATTATLTYSVNGAVVTKSIQSYVYGSRAASCIVTTASRASLSNYQDLWLTDNEPGWGVNVTHQDNTLFATLFTYDSTGRDLWLVMSGGVWQADGSYLGDLYRTTGPAFNAVPFIPIVYPANYTRVGTMRFTFAGGNSGTMAYSVNGAAVTKAIKRAELRSPFPACY